MDKIYRWDNKVLWKPAIRKIAKKQECCCLGACFTPACIRRISYWIKAVPVMEVDPPCELLVPPDPLAFELYEQTAYAYADWGEGTVTSPFNMECGEFLGNFTEDTLVLGVRGNDRILLNICEIDPNAIGGFEFCTPPCPDLIPFGFCCDDLIDPPPPNRTTCFTRTSSFCGIVSLIEDGNLTQQVPLVIQGFCHPKKSEWCCLKKCPVDYDGTYLLYDRLESSCEDALAFIVYNHPFGFCRYYAVFRLSWNIKIYYEGNKCWDCENLGGTDCATPGSG